MPMMLRQARITTTDASSLLQTLKQQEVTYTVQLSDALRQLQEVQKRYEQSEGKQKKSAGEQLTDVESRIATAQQRLGDVREQVAQLKRDGVTSTAVVGGSAGVSVAQAEDRIFNLKPAEFYSGLGFVLWFPIMLAFARRLWRGPAR